MRALSVVLAIMTLAFDVQAASYRWRLSEKEALAIAERAMVAKHFKLSQFPDRAVKRHEDQGEWFVSFSPPMPAAVDSDVLVVVNDRTRRAKVFFGA